MAEAVGTIRVDLFANVAEFGEGLNKASGNLKRFQRDADKIAKSFERTGQNLTRSLTLPLVAFGGFAIKAAADAQDLQGAFNVSFGAMAGDASAWAEETGNALGRSTQRVQTTAIAFNEFFEDFAPNAEAATDLSKSFTVLTEDFAAFHDVSREQSQQVLLSGLAGSAKALKKFGIDISDAAVEAKAYELGIAKVNAELTEQQKVLARASIIIQGTAKEQGEVARSQGEAAEETIRAREAFNELLVTVGNDLLPVFSGFLSVVHDIISGFNSLDKNTRNVVLVVAGIAAAAGPAAIAIGALTRAAGFAAAALRVMTAASVGSSGGLKQLGLSAGGAAVSFLALAPAAYEAGKAIGSVVDGAFAPKFEEVKAKAEALRDALISQGVGADQAREAVVELLRSAGGDLSKVTLDNAKAFLKQGEAASETSHIIADSLKPSVDDLLSSFGDLGGKLKDNAEQLQRIRDTVNPTSAALRTYSENLKLAKAAGLDAAEAQRVFGLELIESVGGIDKARTVIDQLPPSVQRMVTSLTAAQEFDTLMEVLADKSEADAERIKKAHDEAAEAAKRLGEEFQRFADDLNEQFDPAAVFEEQMARIEAAYAAGKISAEVYKKAKDAAFAETPEGKQEAEALRQRAALVYDLAGGLTEIATAGDDAAETAKRFVLEMLKAQVLKPFFQGLLDATLPKPGSTGGGFGFDNPLGAIVSAGAGLFGFGGSRDTGGPVFPGMSYRIGRGVEETFTPSVPGHVSRGPGGANGGGGINMYITTPDANSFRASQRQVARAGRRALEPNT